MTVKSPSENDYADAMAMRSYLRRLLESGISVPVAVMAAAERLLKRREDAA